MVRQKAAARTGRAQNPAIIDSLPIARGEGPLASSYGTDADKSSLRSNYLSVRKAIPTRNRASSDASIRSSLRAFPIFGTAELVLTYVSFGPEVDTRSIIAELLEEGRRVAVPRVSKATRSMDFCEILSPDELEPGVMGILEPASNAEPLTTPELVGSVCLVPGLVFDGAGHRVGYGGGYYDRFLAFYPGDKIALARTTMLSSNPLPVGEHDVPVDFIATESGIWNCRGR